jgi:hypothetical protein
VTTPILVNADARPHSRRQILRGLAISAVAVATGTGTGLALTQAKAAADHTDAALVALFAEWQASAAEDDAACEACADAHDRVAPTPMAEEASRLPNARGRWEPFCIGSWSSVSQDAVHGRLADAKAPGNLR